MATTKQVAQRVGEIQRAEQAVVKAAAAAAKREKAERLKQQAVNDLALAKQRRIADAASKAEDRERREHPITVTLLGGGLLVRFNVSSRDVVTRQTAVHEIGVALNRLHRHEEARIGVARTASRGVNPNTAATPVELAAFLSDEIRRSIKNGVAEIVEAPEKGKRT
jgi:hypothetical protein